MKTHKVRMLLRVVAVLAFAVTGGKLAQAQSCNVSWTGNAGDALWSTAGNWSTNQVPGPTSDVCILTAPSGQGACAPVGCVDARGVPSISIHSLQVNGGVGLFFGPGTVSIATSLTVQAPQTAQYASVVDLYFGTNLNAPLVDVQYGGALLGYGTIEGSLTNNGYIRVDGALTVTGNYTQTSGGGLLVHWGLTGILNVNGNATLSGSLGVVTDAPKFPPKSGSTYTFMTYGSLSGEFTSVTTSGISVKYNTNSAVAKYH